MASNPNGKDFLFSSDCGFIKDEDGEGYKYSDGSGYYHGKDGSEGYIYSDGSGYYHGADGSDGYIYSDGSAYYHGADGSDGYKYSDGSGYYHGADGSSGNKYSDGSGSFYDSDHNHVSYESSYDDDEDENEEKSWGEIIGETIGAMASTVIISAMEESHRQREIEKEAEHKRQLELKRIDVVKEREAQKRAEIKRKERQEWRRQHKAGITITILLAIAIGLFSIGYYEYQKLLPIGYSEADLIGLNYTEVVQKLENNGFKNVYAKEVSDLSLKNENERYLVTDIELEFIDKFNADTKYPYDMWIKVIYHTVKLYNAPLTSKDGKNANYLQTIEKFEEAGFTNIKTNVQYDIITGWITDDGAVEAISINGKVDYDYSDEFRPDAEVVITYHTLKKNKPK